jgi:hypothetical protein
MTADDEEATRQALRRFQEDGSDLGRPMTIDFYVLVPDEAVAHVALVRTAAMGFSSRVEVDEAGAWTCCCTVTIVPGAERVIALERLLDRLARELGGRADGFGSLGNARP